jgi:hypothetical protein
MGWRAWHLRCRHPRWHGGGGCRSDQGTVHARGPCIRSHGRTKERRVDAVTPVVDNDDKDLPLRDDIRLLGRILGDTVCEQNGEAVFDIIEPIPQRSVRFRRDEEKPNDNLSDTNCHEK